MTKPSPAIIEFLRRMSVRKSTDHIALSRRDMRKIVRLHDEQVQQIQLLEEQLHANESQ